MSIWAKTLIIAVQNNALTQQSEADKEYFENAVVNPNECEENQQAPNDSHDVTKAHPDHTQQNCDEQEDIPNNFLEDKWIQSQYSSLFSEMNAQMNRSKVAVQVGYGVGTSIGVSGNVGFPTMIDDEISPEQDLKASQSINIEVDEQSSTSLGVSGSEELHYVPSKFEETTDRCCQSYQCNGLFKIRGKRSVEKRLELSESLHKARELGIKGIGNAISNVFTETPLGATIRDAVVYGWFIISFILFIVDVVHFAREKDPTKIQKATISITIIGLVFSIFDVGYHLYIRRLKTCKEWKTWYENNKLGQKFENQPEPDSTGCCGNACKCFPNNCTTIVDIIRLIVVELMFYPELILEIFEFIMLKIDNKKLPPEVWLKNICSFAGQFILVYMTRTFVLVGTVWSIKKVTNKKRLISEGVIFHLSFVVYVICQMIIQIFMIVVIAGRFQHEYRDYNATQQKGEDYNASGKLVYMIIFGYLSPIFAVFMFFVVHPYWTQKFSISTFRHMLLLIIKKPGIVESIRMKKTAENETRHVGEVIEYIGKLDEDFNKYKTTHIENKILYPFTSPIRVILCFVYFAFLLAFLICFLVEGPSASGWIVAAVSGALFTCIVNIYAFSIVFCYVVIIYLIMLAVVFFLVLSCLSSPATTSSVRNTIVRNM